MTHRNLRKSDLGAVIFGCKNSTMKECLTKQLFGLPSQHFAYVKNIDVGLPLFLFNYSDRNLHGIFEAATAGRLSIDPYAWTNDGSEKTLYPAQVQVRVRLHCQPLLEKEFASIIADSYYARSHFWFELDHAQASKLLSLFLSRPQLTVPSGPFLRSSSKCQLMYLPSPSPQATKVVEAIKSNDHSSHLIGNFGSQDSSSQQDNGQQQIDTSLKVEENEKGEPLHQQLQKLAVKSNFSSTSDEPAVSNQMNMEDSSFQKVGIVQGKQAEDNALSQLKMEIEDLKASKKDQTIKVACLEQKLIQSEAEILRLREYCATLLKSLSGDSGTSSHMEEIELSKEPHVDLDNTILFFGGYDGISWLSSLDSYSPLKNVVRSLKPMSSVRAYASVAKLNGQFYVVGGGNGNLWCSTVESFDPVDNQWNLQPSLKEEKGSLATAAVANKIFAMGGGDGNHCFSNVEMLDLDVGRWIPTRSMLQKRFSLAAAALNDVIYAVGGFDGSNYLSSAERFDPREHSWNRIGSMNSRRGSHSLVVLNEKLYALGGFDGNSMVPSVEVYDPRRGTWVLEGQMKNARGFASAVALRDSIYVFGGFNTDGVIVQPVEHYQVGRGWKIENHDAIRKKCFSSAIVFNSGME